MGILNSIPSAKDRTVNDTTVSVPRDLITEPLQNTEAMAERYGLLFVNRCSLAVYQLDNTMGKQGKTVKYNMLPVVFLYPYKMYTCNAKCGEIITYGYGSSSFKAIDDAANKFLEKLASVSEMDDHLGANPPCLKINVEENDTASDEQGMFTNYIGKLQDEICVARGWSLPKYEYFQSIEGENNNKVRLFTVKCSAGPYESKGVGKTKKIAKKQAAQLLIEQNNLNQYTSRSNVTHKIVDKSKFNTITPKNIEVCDVLKFVDIISFNKLLSSKEECMQKLKKCNSLDELNMSAFEFLEKLAEQELLKITYKPRQKDCCGVEMTLEIVKDKPIMVCLNTGKTHKEAKNAAAKTALKYFKHFLN
ncbi:interferon-inducible double-stranded RNA-dependent protein kinase activator A homolog [Aphis gossypii]|uniref:interferon-inducible double-stranded RNA-dependent protein kinase activator A homolog n=1 Tax=Aphis gossypii TaxID=80765 RepID=UPI002158CC3E|nr:interferon-inducible double-stranded RNA-dependent protein kinase activator A homolog [Aphis gossypii]